VLERAFGPGLTSVTTVGTFSIKSSMRRESMNPLIACFEAAYAPRSGTPKSAVTEATVMNAPPRRWGMAIELAFTTPQ